MLQRLSSVDKRPPMARLMLVRHGESEWNRRGLLQNCTDTPLIALGSAQARTIGVRLVSKAPNEGQVCATLVAMGGGA